MKPYKQKNYVHVIHISDDLECSSVLEAQLANPVVLDAGKYYSGTNKYPSSRAYFRVHTV